MGMTSNASFWEKNIEYSVFCDLFPPWNNFILDYGPLPSTFSAAPSTRKNILNAANQQQHN